MEKIRMKGTVRGIIALLMAMMLFFAIQMMAHATAEEGATVTVNEDKDNVNVRSQADTGSSKVGKVSGGDSFTVLGSTTGTDGKLWYNISGTIGGKDQEGYIRSDFVTVSEAAPTEAAQTVDPTAEGGAAADPTATESGDAAATTAETQADSVSTSMGMNNLIALDPVSDPPRLPAGFSELNIRVAGATEVKAWGNGEFYILYGNEAGKDSGWYLYDSVSQHYVRYTGFLIEEPATAEAATAGVPMGIVIVLAILLVVAVVVAVIFAVKAFGGKGVDNDDDDDDDDYDDDDDDYDDEDEDDEEDYRPAKNSRPAKGQPVRRSEASQDARREAAPRRQAAPSRGAQPVRRSAQQPAQRRANPAPRQSRPTEDYDDDEE